ncbi:MAG: hypothetical protein ACI83I_001644 [Bacteroidia bacterium]|jgi:hypothetical protein
MSKAICLTKRAERKENVRWTFLAMSQLEGPALRPRVGIGEKSAEVIVVV